ncbi:hypothetical protein [Nocardioides sp. zg-DK7169]|uniref:hypothetical protein n=1 Tax=Nocardioides sp. zg-DK7169 TaxID=2736600 RepID=UPI0015547313|nr:hypothetical protein [Nocardioides sp. zg-DK7169]NPC97792.1 hypothetical protein [Nocardioides sp. zg-DK7169]
MDTATWLLVEGLLIGGLVGLRTVCVHLLDPGSVPRCVHGRIELSNRLAPWFGAVAVAMVLTGLALMAA